MAFMVQSFPQGKLVLLSYKGSMDLRKMYRDSGDFEVAHTARDLARQTTGTTPEDVQKAAALEKEKIKANLNADTKSAEISPIHADLIKQQQAARTALRTASKSTNAPSTTRKPVNDGMVRATRPLPGSVYETQASSCSSPSNQQSPYQLAVPQLSSSNSETAKPLTVLSTASSSMSAESLPSTR